MTLLWSNDRGCLCVQILNNALGFSAQTGRPAWYGREGNPCWHLFQFSPFDMTRICSVCGKPWRQEDTWYLVYSRVKIWCVEKLAGHSVHPTTCGQEHKWLSRDNESEGVGEITPWRARGKHCLKLPYGQSRDHENTRPGN